MAQDLPSGQLRPAALWIWIPAALILAASAGAGLLLLLQWLFPTKTDLYELGRSAAVLLGLVVGSGGVAIAIRRQVAAERRLRLDHQDLELRVAIETTRKTEAADIETRRLAELETSQQIDALSDLRARYVVAAEQLGHEAAAIRLAGAYAMAQLASEWSVPAQRQMCVDVLCGYLRMPALKASDPGGNVRESAVRESIQRLLVEHLRAESPDYWGDVQLDLRGAHISVTDLTGIATRGRADFSGARFTPSADFSGSKLLGSVSFQGATFDSTVTFDRASFGSTSFANAKFKKDTRFTNSEWTEIVDFSGATFSGKALFSGSQFAQRSLFEAASFDKDARFHSVRFAGPAIFGRTVFSDTASFYDCKFVNGAGIAEATFAARATFKLSSFAGTAGFASVTANSDFDLSDVEFADLFKAKCSHFGGQLHLERSVFRKGAWLERATFASSLIVAQTSFSEVPRVEGAVFTRSVSWASSTLAGGRWAGPSA